MGLFDPVWMTDNNKKQAKAIEYIKNKVNDDETLLRVFRQAKLNDVKRAAAEKLSGNEARVKAAVVCHGLYERWIIEDVVINRLDDDETLIRIIEQAKDSDIKAAAAERLTSDAARLKTILECDNLFVQGNALSGIKDRSLINRDIYFALTNSGDREKLISEINDERLLGEIVLHDPNPTNRLLALEKISDENIARIALEDKDKNVRAEAVFHIQDNDIMVQYLSHYGAIPYKKREKLFERIDSFTKEQLETLLEGKLNDATGEVKQYICGKAGHQRGEHCRCVRCSSYMGHDFDEKNTCIYCGARLTTYRETLKIMGEPYGYRNNQEIVYTDGTRETIKHGQAVVTADEATMKWLISDN